MRCVEDECRQKTTEEGKGWSSVVVLRFATTCRSQEGQWGCAGTNNQLVGGRQQASLRHTSSSVKGIPTSSSAECRRMQSPRFSRKPGRAESQARARWHLSAGMAGKAKIRRTSALSSTTLLCLSLGNKGFVSTFCFAPSTTRITPTDDQNSSWKEG